MRVRLATVLLAMCAATVAACVRAPDEAVTVFAAASLTDAFTQIARAFEDASAGIDVELNFAGSSSLREQILEGAPADVFAPADRSNMEDVMHETSDPHVFATNRLRIVVPSGNPAGVAGLEDFADPDLLIGLCAAEVPCGDFGRQALARAGVTPSLDTNEPDVRALLTKVEAGELDAGIVYRSDVIAAGDAVEGIDIPAQHNVVAEYPIATLRQSDNLEAARTFVRFVGGAEGQAILRRYGFGAP